MISSMIKAVEIPDEDEDKPRILAFLCENDAYPRWISWEVQDAV